MNIAEDCNNITSSNYTKIRKDYDNITLFTSINTKFNIITFSNIPHGLYFNQTII